MSNQRPKIQTIFVTLLLLAVPAQAQSAELIEAVRVHRSSALALAKAELSACGACPAAARLSLLTGFLMLSAGDPRAAVGQLAAKPAPKGLEAFAAWYLTIAKAYSGDRAGALKAVKAIGKGAPEWLKRKAAVRTGELWLQQGDAKKALPLLEAAAQADDLPDLLYGRGVARLFGGQAEKGLVDLKSVVVRYPAHPHAALALERLTAAKKPPVFSIDDRFTREAAFLAAGDPKAAAAELDAIEVPSGTGKKSEATRASLSLARATVLFALGQEKEGYEKLDAAMGGPTWVAASAMMVRARRVLRSGDNVAARALMLQLDQQYPNEAPADEAAYLAGWIAMQAGDFPNAVKDFTVFEERHADSKKRDEARWFRAYSQIRQDLWAEARATIAGLLTEFPKSQLVPQAKYWAARCGQLLGARADAGIGAAVIGGEYREVIATSPGSFYALLAQQRLRESGADVPQVFVPRQLLMRPR